ncbi:MAG TPA: ABC transporter permease subunit [Anaerolineae bacterium]|nr:ABC transporter permease subunit [Anaerolineae bacterium]
MLNSIFAKTLRDSRSGIVWWGLGVGSLALLVGLLYPAWRDNAASLQSFLESFLDTVPPAFTTMFGFNQDLFTLQGWADIELLVYLPLLLAIATIAACSGAFAGEEDQGTLDLLLSQPVERWRVGLEKFAAVTLATLAATVIVLIFFVGGLAAANVPFDVGRVILATFNGVPLALLMGALALFGSALFPSRGLAVVVPAALLTASFFLDSFAQVIDSLRAVRRLSLYYYYAASKPLTGSLEWGHVALLLGLTVVFLLAGLWAFERRELRV